MILSFSSRLATGRQPPLLLPLSVETDLTMTRRGTEAWRLAHFGKPCKAPRQIVDFAGAPISVDRRAAVSFRALAELFRREYGRLPDPSQTGAYNCRKIGNSSRWSAHAWGLAVDVDWRKNPMQKPLTTVVPASLRVVRTRLITAASGAPVFRWGGVWQTPDPMHFEVIAAPTELNEGLRVDGGTVVEGETRDMIQRGDRGPTVEWWQHRLLAWRADVLPEWGADGAFGEETERAVRLFEDSQNLPQTGIIDLTRGAALVVLTSGSPPDLGLLLEGEQGQPLRATGRSRDDWPAD